MGLASSLIERLNTLIKEGEPISYLGKQNYGYTYDEIIQAEGWLISASHLIKAIVPDITSPYRSKGLSILTKSEISFGGTPGPKTEHVSSMLAVLNSLRAEIDAKTVISLEDRIRANVFEDFLDHASEYLKKGRKEAGVIAGVVFEDTARKIAEKHKITEQQIEDIISELVKRDVLTEAKAKRARAAATVRTKATHARWDEFDLKDVAACIDFTREFIELYGA